jgi:hypothetical protein
MDPPWDRGLQPADISNNKDDATDSMRDLLGFSA